MFDILLFIAASVVACAVVAPRGDRLFGDGGTKILLLGVLLRAVGSTARLEVMNRFYRGFGDAKGYFLYGVARAPDLLSGNFQPYFEEASHYSGTWFMRWITSFHVALLGENMRLISFVYSMYSFFGVMALVVAFRNAFGPGKHVRRFLALALLWPSLWYWPACIGKDGLMLLGMGLAGMGYVGRGGKLRIQSLLAGLLLTSAIRPHIAATIALAIAGAEVLGARKKGSATRRIAQRIGLVALAGIVIYQGAVSLVGDADLTELTELYEFRSSQTQKGGSQIAAYGGPIAVPLGLVNIFLRPFPWEVRHPLQLVASMDVWAIWLGVFLFRRSIREQLRGWRDNRFVCWGLIVTMLIAVMYGLTFFNLGIIARQRVVLLPFLLIPMAFARRRPVRAAPLRPQLRAVP